jgi:3-dehydroquinate synthase
MLIGKALSNLNKSDICKMNDAQSKNMICPVITLNEFRKRLNDTGNAEFLILVDENTRKYCLPVLLKFFPELNGAAIFELPSGEINKTLQHCEMVWQFMSERQFSRKAVVINLGGGVLCDMGGLIAALYKRGVVFYNIPTTLLAMVDAAHGGKVAVDLMPYKNQIGLFQFAEALVLHPEFLLTLPKDELISGWAEMLKHALISDDAYWLNLIAQNPENIQISLIEKSIAVKANIVKSDPMEQNVRKLLNFGHTVGHAIESHYLTSSTPLKHGHAVALGMLVEAQISYDLGLLSIDELAAIGTNITKLYAFPSDLCEHTEALFELMLNDKKNSEGQVKMVLLEKIGKAIYDQHVDFAIFQKALHSATKNHLS